MSKEIKVGNNVWWFYYHDFEILPEYVKEVEKFGDYTNITASYRYFSECYDRGDHFEMYTEDGESVYIYTDRELAYKQAKYLAGICIANIKKSLELNEETYNEND